MAATIQIKRASSATANTAPSGNLAAGELAVSYGNAPANDNGGGRLFVGNSAGNGNIVIGGEYFADLLDHAPGTLTASSAIVTNSSGQIDTLKVGKTSTAGIIDLLEGDGGSAKVRVQAPNALGSDVTLTLPTSAGSNGQFMQVNGSGQLSFATVTSSFTLSDGSTTDSFSTGETLTFTGGEGIDTAVTSGANGLVTITAELASTSNVGSAKFNSADFAVSGAGDVTIHSVSNAQLAGSIANAKLANSTVTIGSTSTALGATSTDIAGLTSLVVDDLTLNGADISTPDSNKNITLTPHGTGTVVVPTGYKDRSGFTANSLATKAYVDATKSGLDIKDSVKLASTAALATLTYSQANGTLTGSGNASINASSGMGQSVTLAANDRVLIKDQAESRQNGIYIVTTVGGSESFVLTRASDADTGTEFTGGSFTFVEQGTNANNGYVFTHDGEPTLTDSTLSNNTQLPVSQFSGAGQITAGDGLTKSSNTINAVGTSNRISVSANAIDISTNYVGQNTITTLGTITTGTWNGTTIGTSKGGTGLTAAAKGSILVANTADTFTALDGGGSTDKILFYNQGSDTITWESSLDAGTF